MILNLFPLPIYAHRASFEEFDEIKKEIESQVPFEELNFRKPHNWINDINTTFGSDNLIHKYQLLKLQNFISIHVKNYLDEIESEERTLVMTESWINKTAKYQSQEFHSHLPEHISGVFYIQTNQEDGRIIFKNPNPFSSIFPFTSSKPDVYTEQYKIVPEQGGLLLFPSYLEHCVEQNFTDHERITLAFNFRKLEEKY